jgi:hypothetical protein
MDHDLILIRQRHQRWPSSAAPNGGDARSAAMA